MMPDGARMERLCNEHALNRYLKENGKLIYHYAKNVRGRDIENGGLRVVIGSVKSISWGIATFRLHASKQSNIHLEFQSLHESNDLVYPMSWKYTIDRGGTADVRVGPDLEEIQELQSMRMEGRKLCNQSLSTITLTVHLCDDDWEEIVGKESVKAQIKSGALNFSSSVPSPPETPPSQTRSHTNLAFPPLPNHKSDQSNESSESYSLPGSSEDDEPEDLIVLKKPSFSSVCFFPLSHTRRQLNAS